MSKRHDPTPEERDERTTAPDGLLDNGRTEWERFTDLVRRILMAPRKRDKGPDTEAK